ncbi:MAG: hypothetical protein WC011_03835 [Candidatus Paceibacterota bacterium]
MEKRPNFKHEKQETYEDKISRIAELFKNERIAQVVIHAKENNEPRNENQGLTSAPDLDTQVALYLLNNLNKKPNDEIYTEDAQSSLIIKGGNEKNLKNKQKKEGLNIFVDVGGSFLRIQKQGKETIVKLDHHGAGQRRPTSATQMMYDILQKADLLNTEDKWVKNLVKTVNSIDNLSYVNRKNEKGEKIWDEEYFKNEWPYSVEAIAEHLPLPTLIQLYKENKIRNSAQVFTDEELDNIIRTIKPSKEGEKSIVDIITENKENATKTLESLKIAIELNKKNGLETEDTIIGKTIYHNYEKIDGIKSNNIPFKTAYLGTKALGYDSFAGFNPDPKKLAQRFFVNSTHPNTSKLAEQLNSRLPGTLDIRGTFIFPPKDTKDLKNFKEEDFIKQLIPRQKINPKPNKIEKEIPSKSEEDKKDNTETKIDEEVSPEIKPQTERQKRIAELLKNQKERDKQIQALEKQLEDLRTILIQIQEQETQTEALNNPNVLEQGTLVSENTNTETVLKTEESKKETKRDRRENYEGWETRYHHEIEEDNKSILIKKERKEQDKRSIYELKVKDNQMVMFLIETQKISNFLSQYYKSHLEPIFNMPGIPDEEYDKELIKTIRPAKFRKEGERWVLEEKGEVEYIK